ncbi:MAG: S41 family peptidase [Bacteroidetes bacterium]|nr:S41 family peptidase [Bacteroidota bacterium]
MLRKKAVLLSIVVISSALSVGWLTQTAGDNDYYYEVKRGIRLFGDIYKNITEKYVDEVSPREFIRSGIDGLLGALDPYTMYYEGPESGDLDALMMGKYGGVGISVGIKDGFITVITTMDGSPAQRAGILPGDHIVAVDELTRKEITLQQMSNFVKGEPGTKVKLVIEREGQDHQLEFELIREMIAVENISFAGMVDPTVGYIKLTKFSKTANFDFHKALKDLKQSGMQALILDLRGNPGGLLDVAIDITNEFVKKGQLITYTKGRMPDANRYYNAANEPMLPDIPLLVLVDEGSASASEIVAGALQDLDRAVLVGSTTFGKGLVQTLYPLQEKEAVLKITTAKYFTPSGRCIQKENYTEKRLRAQSAGAGEYRGPFETFGEDDASYPSEDTLKSNRRQLFKTTSGRSVFSDGGINPDVEISAEEYPIFVRELLRKGLVFDYATYFVSRHPTIDSAFTVTDEQIDDFKDYLSSKNFSYQSRAEQQMSNISELAHRLNYDAAVRTKIENLKVDLRSQSAKEFENSRPIIRAFLEQEIISRYFGNRARIIAGFRHDLAYKEARTLLVNRQRYENILAGK